MVDEVVWRVEDWWNGTRYLKRIPVDLAEILETKYQDSKTIFVLERTQNRYHNEGSLHARVQYLFNFDELPWSQTNLSTRQKRALVREVKAFDIGPTAADDDGHDDDDEGAAADDDDNDGQGDDDGDADDDDAGHGFWHLEFGIIGLESLV